ncbi:MULTISPECIES: hypothetical protein [unclassified Pseudoxanthomonas]|uniref:hypothetical protein n=1 Tax=unclassified Pseudoxanthomonas TaxID=2645906 RepID=UPI003077023E
MAKTAQKKTKRKVAPGKVAEKVGTSLADAVLARRTQAERRRAKAIAKVKLAPGMSVRSAGIVVAEGDSWFDYPFNDILKGLEDDHGYDVESVAQRGHRVEDMAYSEGQLDDFARRIEKVMRNGTAPKAILVSGGGNDIAGPELAVMINHAMSNIAGLNNEVVAGIIDTRLSNAYITILSAITRVCEVKVGSVVRIVLHGYDYPVPDGRGVLGGAWKLPGPWLEPSFRMKGYGDMQVRIALMKALIDRFNAMLLGLTRRPGFGHVKFVDLRRTLSTASDYKKWWGNELHPTESGFTAVTKKIAAAIP